MKQLDSKVLTKYVKLLVESDSADLISYSNLQYSYLKTDEDFYNYFSLLSKSNIFYAAIVLFYFKKRHRLANEKVESLIMNRISARCSLLQGDSINLRSTNTLTSDQINSMISDINSIAELCVADLIINDNEQIHQDVFLKTVKRIKSREDSYGLFLSRCSELLSLMENQSRCIYVIRLIGEMRRFFNDENNRVLHLIIKVLSNWPLRFYGDNSSPIITFIIELFNIGNPHILQVLLELFPQIDFDLLSTDVGSLLRMTTRFQDPNRIEMDLIKLLHCAVILNNRNKNGLLEEEFKDLVYSEFASFLSNNPPFKDTVDLFFICNGIKEKPQEVNNYLVNVPVSKGIYRNALMMVEQNAFAALVRDNPRNVVLFLRKLGDANAFRLNYPVRNMSVNYNIRRPEITKNEDLYRSQLERLSIYCGIDDLVYIYFNSSIRTLLPIEELLRKVYDHSHKKADNYMKVSKTFSEYVIEGKIATDRFKKPYFTTEQFATRSRYLAVIGYNQFTPNVVRKLKSQDEGRIRFLVDSVNIASEFNPQIKILISGENKPLDKKETINYYVNYLKSLADRRDFTDEDIAVLRNIPKVLSMNSDYVRLGMGILKCCYSFDDNRKSVRFLESVANNPYKSTEYFNQSLPMKIRLDREDYQLCLDFVKRVSNGNGFFEDKLYLYFNTILKTVYYFDSFVVRVAEKREFVDLQMLYNSYGIRVHGKVKALADSNIIISPYAMDLSYEWKVVAPKRELDANSITKSDQVSFVLNSAHFNRRIILVEDLEKRSFRNTAFCASMNKAKLTLDLDRYDLHNLLCRPSGLTMKEMNDLAINELLAIKLRMSPKETLEDFLKYIEESNPWTFSNEIIPCIVLRNRYIRYSIESTINDLIDIFPLEFAINVYFNTSIKSTISVDHFARLLIAKYKDSKRVISLFSKYNISIVNSNSRLGKSSNLYIREEHFSSCDVGVYIIEGYDKQTKLLRLRKKLS